MLLVDLQRVYVRLVVGKMFHDTHKQKTTCFVASGTSALGFPCKQINFPIKENIWRFYDSFQFSAKGVATFNTRMTVNKFLGCFQIYVLMGNWTPKHVDRNHAAVISRLFYRHL